MWQALLQNWLQQQAKARVFETLKQSAAEQMAGGEATADELLSPPPPCDVGLVFALGIELGGLEDLLEGVLVTHGPGFTLRQGGLNGRSVVVVESGVGIEAASRATELLISVHHPQWVISAGFAGGLQPQLKRHDIVLVDSVAERSGRRLAIDVKLSPEAVAATPGLHVGRLLTVDQIVATSAEKQALGRKHDAVAVDMESWGVAEVCRREQTRFLSVRVISDPMDEELPADLNPLMQQKSVAGKLGAVTGALFRRPSSVKDMLKLKETALVASDRLAKFLAGTIPQLVPKRQKADGAANERE